jgi:hypothetical protein
MSEMGANDSWTLAVKAEPAAKWNAFISYVRDDDDAYGGIVTRLHTMLQGQLAECGGNVYLDKASSLRSVNYREGVKSVLRDFPVFIPILSPRWFRSEECVWEYSQFAVLTHHEDYDEDHYPLPLPGRGEVIPVSLGDINEIRKSFNGHKARELLMAPGEELLNLEVVLDRDETLQPFVSALRDPIREYWRKREWRLDPPSASSTTTGEIEGPTARRLGSRTQEPIDSADLSPSGTFLDWLQQRCLTLNLSTESLPAWLGDVGRPFDGWNGTAPQTLLVDMLLTQLSKDEATPRRWLDGLLRDMGVVDSRRSAKAGTQSDA